MLSLLDLSFVSSIFDVIASISDLTSESSAESSDLGLNIATGSILCSISSKTSRSKSS